MPGVSRKVPRLASICTAADVEPRQIQSWNGFGISLKRASSERIGCNFLQAWFWIHSSRPGFGIATVATGRVSPRQQVTSPAAHLYVSTQWSPWIETHGARRSTAFCLGFEVTSRHMYFADWTLRKPGWAGAICASFQLWVCFQRQPWVCGYVYSKC